MVVGESTEILSSYTSQAQIKSIALSSHEQLPAKSWRIVRTILHSKASHLIESQRKILHHKELNLGCSVTITNGPNIYICFVVYGSQVIKTCYSSFFVNFKGCKPLIKCKSLWQMIVKWVAPKVEEYNWFEIPTKPPRTKQPGRTHCGPRAAGCTCLF